MLGPEFGGSGMPVRGSVMPGAPGGVTAPGLNPRVPALGAAPGALVDPLGEPPVVCAAAEVMLARKTSTTGAILAFITFSGVGSQASTAATGQCSTSPETAVTDGLASRNGGGREALNRGLRVANAARTTWTLRSPNRLCSTGSASP